MSGKKQSMAPAPQAPLDAHDAERAFGRVVNGAAAVAERAAEGALDRVTDRGRGTDPPRSRRFALYTNVRSVREDA